MIVQQMRRRRKPGNQNHGSKSKSWWNQNHGDCYLGWIIGTKSFKEQYIKNKVEDWVKDLQLLSNYTQDQGCTTFCYCWPHYFYLYEVRLPMSSSYIYEIRLIKERPSAAIKLHTTWSSSSILSIHQRIIFQIDTFPKNSTRHEWIIWTTEKHHQR